MRVTYVDHMGSDVTVVNAARVSFDNETSWAEGSDYFHSERGWLRWDETRGVAVAVDFEEVERVLRNRDRRLIHFLAREGHWSPFAHAQVQVRCDAPIFLARQLVKHQVGLAWNEVSRRYVDYPVAYFEPRWRRRARDKKQGSGGPLVDWRRVAADLVYRSAVYACDSAYRKLLRLNVAPEQARTVLPLSMYTSWYWTGSLYALARVYNQRTDEHAQFEAREFATQLGDVVRPLFPVSWGALTEDVK